MIDVESIRVDAERSLARELRSRVREARIDTPREASDRLWALRAQGVRLTAAGAPAELALLRQACARLGIDTPVEVWASTLAGTGAVDACVMLDPEDPVLRIAISPRTLEAIGDPELQHLVGHELGHALAHRATRATELTPYGLARAIVCGAHALDPVDEPTAYRLHMACEMTADRFGLLASRDLSAAVRLEMVSCTEMDADEVPSTPEEFLEDARLTIATAERRGEGLAGLTHPKAALRCHALELFYESERYATLTGRGPARRSNEEVETRIAALLALVDPDRTARAFERSARAAHAARHVAPSPRAVLYERLEDLDDRIVGTTTKLVRAVTSSIDRLVGRTVNEEPDEPTTIEDHAEDEDPEKRALLERFAALERELAKKKRN